MFVIKHDLGGGGGGESLFERHCLPLPVRSDLIGKPYLVSMLVVFVYTFFFFFTICCFVKY